jgi:purine catabolism regulator
MGISVGEMLQKDFFKAFELIAGHKGLNKHIQGVAVLDAPDGFNWTRGREFIVSSGYVFMEKHNLIQPYLESGTFANCSCIGIKIGRFLDTMPPDLIEACDTHNIPLLRIPKEIAWMDIMNTLNVIVMNKNIEHFNIGKVHFNNLSDLSYQTRKINKILSAVEFEMNFPAMLYYLSNDEAFYSSDQFRKVSHGMKPEDFWNPPFNFSKEMLCDNLKMARYRIYDPRYDTPYSWITVPITVDNRIRAYFVVLEATGLIDYFDQFALRTSYLLLQELYEQILVTQSIGDIGFESFITHLTTGKLTNVQEIRNHAEELKLDPDLQYYAVLMRQVNTSVSLTKHRDLIRSSIRGIFSSAECRAAITDDQSCLLLCNNTAHLEQNHFFRELQDKCRKLEKRLEADLEGTDMVFGLSDLPSTIFELKRNYKRCLQTLDIGKFLYPDQHFRKYSQLGALAWMNIQEDEVGLMLRDLEQLKKHDEQGFLLETLKIYLECKMNFSLTAKSMFLHINTVRKRIEEVNEWIQLDLDDPVTRLKLEILLHLV